MSVDTSRVTRPRTGFPFLDAGIDEPGSVLAFAHRGGAFHPEIEGLENTRAAFQHAVDLGYRYLETDVHATRDGTLLAFHDAVLDRVTEACGAIKDLEYVDVREALIGGQEQIPTLEELFEAFPHARFNIDLKSTAAIRPLVELIERTDAHDRVCVASFSGRRTRTFRALTGGRVATAAGPVAVARGRFVPATRLVDVLARDPAAALQVPHRRSGLTIVTNSFIARAHAAGRHVHVWTVDDPGQMSELLDMGVDGLMTDRTDLLREVLMERGQWTGAQA